jgi:putative two-component system response regulator
MSSEPSPTSAAQDRHDRRQQSRDADPQRARFDAIYRLARANEAHDEDTGGHLKRIRTIVERIARRLGMSPDDAVALGYDAMLHDVGKMTIPRQVLMKPGALTVKERAVMDCHTTRGHRMLIERDDMHQAARIARHHHEAWDGSGYPDGLAGDAIPLEARITSVADVFDALISQREYKRAWSWEEAQTEIRKITGSRLDPAVVDALMAVIDDGSLRAALENLES